MTLKIILISRNQFYQSRGFFTYSLSIPIGNDIENDSIRTNWQSTNENDFQFPFLVNCNKTHHVASHPIHKKRTTHLINLSTTPQNMSTFERNNKQRIEIESKPCQSLEITSYDVIVMWWNKMHSPLYLESDKQLTKKLWQYNCSKDMFWLTPAWRVFMHHLQNDLVQP